MRILIADDSQAFVQRLTSRLEECAGIEIVGHADNAADATREIRKVKPDVVILDIRMPGGSGIEVLDSLENDSSKPIVMMLTNCSHQQYRRRCLESGASYFFDKSAEFHKVAEALQSLMNVVPA